MQISIRCKTNDSAVFQTDGYDMYKTVYLEIISMVFGGKFTDWFTVRISPHLRRLLVERILEEDRTNELMVMVI